MSFGAFGGFGQNNQQQQQQQQPQQQQQGAGFGAGAGFGGSGSGGGFGSTSSPFGGGNTPGGGLFGNTSSGFGSSGGFGSGTQTQSNPLFGSQNRSGFGASNTAGTGSLFGGGATNTATAAPSFGGFGSTAAPAGGFGSTGAAGGGLFGGKPAGGFGGAAGTTGGFGATGGAFGGTTSSAGFGGGTGTAFQGAVPPCEGTGGTPFSAFQEKDSTSTNVTNHYQSISFMQPYSKYSFEELRVADYNQGRRFGNGSGQAGAFGTSAFGSGAGGFGATAQQGGFGGTSTPFGGGTSAPGGFGATQTAGGFGSSGTGSLFGGGAAKPATSLFGGAGTTQAGGGGGLFGTQTTTPGSFGGTTSGAGAFGGGGGGLFGNQQQQAGKPLFGGTPSAGGGGFGATGGFGTQQQQTTATNPFGGTTATASPFGGAQQQGGTGAFGGLGAQNQAQSQAQTQNKGGLFGGGFGTTAQQPQAAGGTSLFGGGGTTTGSSLFGGATQQQQPPQQQQQGGGLFGGATQQAGTGSLFGGGAQQTGQRSLFGGGGTTGTPTGGGAFSGFGNAPNQQQTGGGLFGNTQAQQAQKPSLFGATGGGGSLFGQQPTAQPTSSLFGGQPAQQPAGGLGTSGLFGASQQAQQSQPAPGSLQASLLDTNPYGNQSIFAGLPAPTAPSPGPLATPLSSTMKQKQRTPLPVYKITPNAANRLITPTKRQGYGFSYSAYGTPSSATSTPGFSGSLLGGSMRGSVNGSFGRSFSKSFSTSNLRKTFEPESESILSPGALSAGASRLSGGSLKRLTIDRSLRTDLFTRPASTPAAPITNGEDSAPSTDKLKKKVSFDSNSPQTLNGGGEVVLVESKSPEPTPEELGFLRSVRKDGTMNGANGGVRFAPERPEAAARAETDTARPGNELAAVPENGEQPAALDRAPARISYTPGADPQPGEYWMKPSRAEINKMSREQQKRVIGLTVGRHRCGQVTFDEPVDLTSVDLDQILGGLVDITVRSITVYPDETLKPPLGKGLNVPSTLRIENSWPRGRDRKFPTPLTSGPLFEKHVDRLRKVHNTEFVDYEKDTGTWVFRVPHFTTYGLDYDSDEEAGESHNPTSTLGAGPDAPTPKAQSHSDLDRTVDSERTATFDTDESFVGSMAGIDDDTFDFKKRKMVPGSFGNQAMMMMDVGGDGDRSFGQEDESFLEEGSTGSTAEHDGDDVTASSQLSDGSVVESDEDAEMDMAGAFPNLDHTVEQEDTFHTDLDMDTTHRSMNLWNTPGKSRLNLSGDWADQLQRTISPRKQDRDALREIQNNAFAERLLRDETPTKPSATTAMAARQKGFSTSIDLMNSLFQQPRKQQAQSPFKKQATPKDFEWPYHKQPITFADQSKEMSAADMAFHQSFKPRWGPRDALVCTKNDMRETLPDPERAWEQGMSVTSEGRDIVVLAYGKRESSNLLLTQQQMSRISKVDGIPFARLEKADFRTMEEHATDSSERLIWRLANILFNDDIEDDISAGVPPQLRTKFTHRIKKDRLSRLWEEIVREKHSRDLDKFETSEERAFLLLCSHRIDEACKLLLDSGNLHLATLIAQIGRDATTRTDMQKQVEMWRQHNIYSEMSESIRALYELLAGNALRSEGKSGGALEDRASTFSLTDRFDLDWYQAFGLRLWYGITEDEPVEAAVAKFYDDLTRGEEPAFPSPMPTPVDDGSRATLPTDAATRESPLWVLLRSYAASVQPSRGSSLPAVEIPAALLPESVSRDRLAHRLSFQLCQFLKTTQGKDEHFKIDKALADRLTWDFAWELCSSGGLGAAIFIIQHLSQAADRERALKETLARFAPELPNAITVDGSPDPTWRILTDELQIPEAWLWIAKALYARDRGDATTEVDCLIRAKNWNEAHATFCRVVGPTAIIERDYVTLETLVSGFGDGPDRRVRGWATGGGGVYEDFLRLATVRTAADRDPARLKRLVNALAAMGDKINQGSGVEGLEERVAFREMSRAVVGWVAQDEVQQSMVDLVSVLKLPLTADARALQTAEMGRRYYNVLMAGAY